MVGVGVAHAETRSPSSEPPVQGRDDAGVGFRMHQANREQGATVARTVRALIVQYRPGVSPRTGDGSVRGASRVTGPLRTALRLGPGLGLNMWRVDFTSPVTLADGRRVARQLAGHPSVVFAEVDTPVTTTG